MTASCISFSAYLLIVFIYQVGWFISTMYLERQVHFAFVIAFVIAKYHIPQYWGR